MPSKHDGPKFFFSFAITGLFVWFLTGVSFANDYLTQWNNQSAGIREVVIAGLILGILTAVYSIILTQKGEDEGGESCGCGRRSKYT